MVKAKKGDYMSCDVCGLVVVVDEACGCAEAMVCCDKPMKKGKAAAAKIKTKAKAATKVAKKKAKPAKKAAKKPAPKKRAVAKKKVAKKK